MCLLYASPFCIMSITSEKFPLFTILWWISIPWSKAPILAHSRRMIIKVVEFGSTCANITCLNVSKAFSKTHFVHILKSPFFYETNFLWDIFSNSSFSLSMIYIFYTCLLGQKTILKNFFCHVVSAICLSTHPYII